MASMNPGKAIAQGSHAANAFVLKMAELYSPITEKVEDTDKVILFRDWRNSTKQGFGTVLVLAVTGTELEQTIKLAQELKFIADVIHDPTYPIQDGMVTHYISLNTCGYIFGDKSDIKLGELLAGYKLHP